MCEKTQYLRSTVKRNVIKQGMPGNCDTVRIKEVAQKNSKTAFWGPVGKGIGKGLIKGLNFEKDVKIHAFKAC